MKTSESLEYLRSIDRIEQADESFLGRYLPNIFEERDIFVTLGIEKNTKIHVKEWFYFSVAT